MAIIPTNRTWQRHKLATDKTLRKSQQAVTQPKYKDRAEAITMEMDADQTATIASLPVTVGFDTASKKRIQTTDRWFKALMSGDDGELDIHTTAEVLIEFAISCETNTSGLDLWKATIQISDDDGANWTDVEHPASAFNYHGNDPTSVVAPARKVQLIHNDKLRIRLDSVRNTDLGSNTYTIFQSGTYLTMRTF